MHKIISVIAGFLFGAGMIVSGMSDPKNVIAFLDITGQWSPDLAFVMGGALIVFAPSYWLFIRKKTKPVCSNTFSISNNKTADKQLVAGASLFGVGWGIAGICPGPSVASVANGGYSIFAFIIAMLVGMYLGNVALKRRKTGSAA